MKHITRDINPESAHDLLEHVPRACIGFADDRGAQAQPVALVWRSNHYWVGIPVNVSLPAPGHEVVLLVDEGLHFFDLRAIYVRGKMSPADAPADAPAGYAWFEILPIKTVAWDYGTLREVDDES